jgi:hypothetical protein
MTAEPRKRGLGWITLLSSTQAKPRGYFYDSFGRKDFTKFQIRAEDCPHLSKEFLEEEKKRLGERMYGVIYNGEFDEDAADYFPREQVDRAVRIGTFSKKEIEEGKRYYLGIDPARFGRNKAAFVVAELTGRDRVSVIHAEQHDLTSMKELLERSEQLDRIFKFRLVFIDDGGVGGGLVDFMRDKFKRRLRPMNNKSRGKDFKILKEDLYSNVLRLLSAGNISLIQDEELIREIKRVEWDELNKKIINNDISEALVRACWCVKEKRIYPKIRTF